MRSWSRKPRVMKSTVGSPLRSSSALVATVVPIFTASMRSTGIGSPGATPEELADAGDGRVAVALRVLRQQLVGDDGAVGTARDDVGERAAAVDPELPAAGMCGAHGGDCARGANVASRSAGVNRIDNGPSRSLPCVGFDPHPENPHENHPRPVGRRSRWPCRSAPPPRPSGTCPRPTPPPTSTPRTSCSSPPTSTRPPAASSRSPCIPTRSLFKAHRDQARGAGRPGADRRDHPLRLLQRGPDLRHRLRALPRHQLRRVRRSCGRSQKPASRSASPSRA